MKRIIDLSYPIHEEMPVYPGDPKVVFNTIQTIKENHYHITQIHITTHTGTHVDVPSHVILNDKAVDAIALDTLVGEAEVIDMGDLAPGFEITAADLNEFADRVAKGSRLIIKTGWGKRYGEPDYFENYPGITEGAAAWLAARGVRLLAIEQPSLHHVRDLEVHKEILSSKIVLIESLANLDKITKEKVYLIALPLNLVGLDGSPLRVIAIEEA